MKNIQLIHGECLAEMDKLIEQEIKVDMILCDLPFGTTKNKWDIVIPFESLWNRYNKLIKDNGAIILFSQTPFDKLLGASNLKMLRYEWIWEKNKATGHLNAKKMPMKAHENILVFYKHLPTYNPQKTTGHEPMHYAKVHSDTTSTYGDGKDTINNSGTTERYPRDVLKFNVVNQSKKSNPCEKPIDLLEYFINTYTNKGDSVLDNCMGSGSTGIACLNTNRNFTGIEKDKKYFDIASERINTYNKVNS